MTSINLITEIKSSQHTVFDVSKNIEIHRQSANKTNEMEIIGITSEMVNHSESAYSIKKIPK